MKITDIVQIIHQSDRLALYSEHGQLSQPLNLYLSNYSPESVVVIDSITNEQFIKKNIKLSATTEIWGYNSVSEIPNIIKKVKNKKVIVHISRPSPFDIDTKLYTLINRTFKNSIFLKDGHFNVLRHHLAAQ